MAGVLVTRPSPAAEGDASLEGGSASGPTPGCASVQPGLVPARSHRGNASASGTQAFSVSQQCLPGLDEGWLLVTQDSATSYPA